jgi:DNA-binding NtrC family response regulator
LNEQIRILVADDDETIRETIATILEDEGYLVDRAENGKEAIEKSNKRVYNVALIDIRLPDMEGTELLTAMKDTMPKMIKIIITGYPAMQNAIDAVNKGADAYILKPVKVDNLLSTIKEHLKKQREAKEFNEEKVTEFIKTRVREIEEEEMPHKKDPSKQQ